MLNNESKYAMRGVIYLAIHASEVNKLGSKEVGEAIKVPLPFLAKIFQHLKKENIISSSKGPKGGFYLTEEQLTGNLMSVIQHIDGTDSFNSCYTGLSKCSDKDPCSIHYLVSPFNNKVKEELQKRSIADFAKDVKQGKSHLF